MREVKTPSGGTIKESAESIELFCKKGANLKWVTSKIIANRDSLPSVNYIAQIRTNGLNHHNKRRLRIVSDENNTYYDILGVVSESFITSAGILVHPDGSFKVFRKFPENLFGYIFQSGDSDQISYNSKSLLALPEEVFALSFGNSELDCDYREANFDKYVLNRSDMFEEAKSDPMLNFLFEDEGLLENYLRFMLSLSERGEIEEGVSNDYGRLATLLPINIERDIFDKDDRRCLYQPIVMRGFELNTDKCGGIWDARSALGSEEIGFLKTKREYVRR